MCDFTICIPTYNREGLLGRAIESILNQSYNDYEILVIDDGSTDNTEDVVVKYMDVYSNIRYFKKENGGKYTALNLAFSVAKGILFLILDSDDILLPNTLAMMIEIWNKMNKEEKELFCGIMGRCESMEGTLIGKPFPYSPFVSSYVDFHYISGPYGDACECIRTDILRQYQFPVYENEQFMAESRIMDRIGVLYKLYCINNKFKRAEYQTDGITSNILALKIDNIQSTLEKYVDLIDYVFPKTAERLKWSSVLRTWINYWRYVFHDKSAIGRRVQSCYKFIAVVSLPLGYAIYIIDKFKLRKRKK